MERNIWDILAWVAFGIVMAYFILKALHILNSPEIADVVTILSAGYFIGRYAMKIEYTDKRVFTLETDMRSVKTNISTVEKSISILESDMGLVKTNLKQIRNRFAPSE